MYCVQGQGKSERYTDIRMHKKPGDMRKLTAQLVHIAIFHERIRLSDDYCARTECKILFRFLLLLWIVQRLACLLAQWKCQGNPFSSFLNSTGIEPSSAGCEIFLMEKLACSLYRIDPLLVFF